MSPLISVDLGALDPTWSGWIHLVAPVEPVEQYLGTRTTQYSSYYTRENWIGFHVDETDHYHLMGDWRIFQAESLDDSIRLDPQLIEFYEERHTAYDRTKLAYQQHGLLLPPGIVDRYGLDYATDSARRHPSELLDCWHEDVAPGGNWASADLFPMESDDEYDTCFPLTEDGRRFRFITSATGYNYTDSGADSILLFWDPVTRIALETFDYG